VCILGSATNETNAGLVRDWRNAGLDTALVSSLETLCPGTVVIGRLDVLPTLDGIEPGLLTLFLLERRGFRVLNRAEALLAAHDKLLTARRLGLAGLPHPHTVGWDGEGTAPLEPPFVLKPRFGSWGRDVLRCGDRAAVGPTVEAIRGRPWFRRHGALLQELVPSAGRDLRLVVAAGAVVAAGERVAAAGEWRTNVSLGGTLRPVDPPSAACSIATEAAAAVGADLVGVDLIPLAEDRYVVIELNGAVDFDQRYSLIEGDVYLDIAAALGLPLAAVL
jgi:RimK family alpha-L-glutamate ligase